MKAGVTGAWAVGVGILITAYALWFISLQMKQYSEPLLYLLWLSPLVAALVSAYIAPYKRILLGLSMAVPSAVLAIALNALYQSLGNVVDFPGVGGGVILFVSTLIYSAILCGLGALAGQGLAKKFRNHTGISGLNS